MLGLFRDEAELRDYVASHLEDLEPGLVLTKVECDLPNPNGSGGRVDVLALDAFDHVVVIEIKRSDQSARSALNELAKYISLLVRGAKVRREAIRCLVLSTDWFELQLPLSFFAATSGVYVEGRKVVRDGDRLGFEAVELTPISDLPQFSPEISLYLYQSESRRAEHLASIRERAGKLPFVRLAVLLLDAPEGSPDVPFRSVVCIWRISPDEESGLGAVIGQPVGWLAPYAYPGWEAECDALYWICHEEDPGTFFSSAEEQRGTPEKVRNLLETYRTVAIERLGDWPKVELVNTDARILSQLEAVTSIVSVERPNRYKFEQLATPKFGPSWRRAVKGFLDFIAFEPVWVEAAAAFLNSLEASGASVILQAFDKNHFFYGVHQAREHPDAQLGWFVIAADHETGEHSGLSGHYVWNGKAPEGQAEAAIERTFGSLGWAVMAAFSAVDTKRYDRALAEHGFEPVVLRVAVDAQGQRSIQYATAPSRDRGRLVDFVTAHPEYAAAVSDVFKGIPTSPRPS